MLGVVLALAAGAPARAQDAAAERLMREAQRRAEAGDAAGALDEYALVVQQFPTDPLAPKALYESAALRRRAGDPEAARRTVEQLLKSYPRAPETAAGFVLQAVLTLDAARTLEELTAARDVLERVPLLYGRDRYPALGARAEARVRSGELARVLGDEASAAAAFLAAFEDEPPGPWRHRARLRLAQAFAAQERWVEAAELLQGLVASGPAAGSDGAEAARLLSLIHRLILRSQTGEQPWSTSGRFPASASPAFKEPTGIAAAEDGRVVIVDAGLPLVAWFERDGRLVESQALRDAARPWWGLDGLPHVVIGGEVVRPFDGSRAAMMDPRPGKEGALKELLAAERSFLGDWFVIAKGFRSLLTFENPRQGNDRLLQAEKPELVDVARDSLGRIFVLDEASSAVIAIGLDRKGRGPVVRGTWKRPVALAIDALGNFYVLDRGERRLEVYDRRGQLITRVGPLLGGGIELKSPSDVTVDGSGRLLLTDSRLPFAVALE